MLLSLSLLSLLAIPALALPAMETRTEYPPYPYPAVQFTGDLPTQFCAGHYHGFTWTGGSGYYSLGQVYYKQGQGSSHPVVLAPNTTETGWSFYVDNQPGSTVLFSVSSGDEGVYYTDPENKRFVNTGYLPIVEC